MTIFGAADFDNHEQVVFCKDAESGLNAIIAIHNTTLGPAVGGCRMWPYGDEAEAIRDVLRLSRGMSYKNAMAGLPLGGGKAVIMGDPNRDKSEELFNAFGRHVERLGGKYVTAEDVGVSVNDMEIVAQQTKHVSGLSKKGVNAGGDPSPKTAYGVFLGILAAVGFQTNDLHRDHLNGIRVAVQGLGAVGYHLSRYLHEAGATLMVSDINQKRIDQVCTEFGATPVDSSEILYQEVDVLAPCALGAILNQQTIPKINTSIIAGAANNQLATDADGAALAERNILFAPDYVINAGGVINVAFEHLGMGSDSDAMEQIQKISLRLIEIFQSARDSNRPTNEIADEMARRLIADKREKLQHAA